MGTKLIPHIFISIRAGSKKYEFTKLTTEKSFFDLFNILIIETTFLRKFADPDVVGHWHTGMVASFSFPTTFPFWKWNNKDIKKQPPKKGVIEECSSDLLPIMLDFPVINEIKLLCWSAK